MQDQLDTIQQLVADAQTIVVVQADNPDGDSIGSALALETILGDMGKTVHLYCGVEMPGYLRYLQGWDRVEKDLPKQFDISIIVDASTETLLEKLEQTGQRGWIASKPCIVLDHHANTDHVIPYAQVMLNDATKSSAGELIYSVATELQWPLPVQAQEYLMTSILGDTQGLSNQLASPATYRVVANMIEAGVDRPALEELRREFGKMPREIFRYKGQLIMKTEFSDDGALACVSIPQQEIDTYSPLYNPGPLIQGDLLQTIGVRVAIVFKHYVDGKITAAIRCNAGAGIGGLLATHFGGGGHDYAAGFKITNGRPFNEVKSECLSLAHELLTKLETGNSDATLQYINENS